MIAEPVTPTFNGYRLGVRGGGASWNRRVIDCHDGRQVSFGGIANRHAHIRYSVNSNNFIILEKPKDGQGLAELYGTFNWANREGGTARGLLPHAGVEVKRDRSAQANLLEIAVRWIEKIILLLGNDGRGHS